MSGRKRMPSSKTDSLDAAAANKKPKKQHSEPQADMTAHSTRSDQDMIIVNNHEEGERLSAYVNAYAISLPLAKLQQNYVKRSSEINKILSDILGDPEKICVGSVAEGLNVSSSDFDTILFANDFILSHQLDYEPIPDEGNPGYSKLLVTCTCINNDLIKYTQLTEGGCFLKNNLKELIIGSAARDHFPNGLNVHGPAYNTVLWESYVEALFRHGETYDNRLDVDFVLCIKRNDRPLQGSEWQARERDSNWPTEQLLQDIMNAGYFLAAVGSKESNESEIQWRVSFNKAEQLIIESLNETQIHCIYLLKLMKNSCLSGIAGKNITSYTMKTIMFWCLEEKSDYYWHPSNLLCCYCFCVSKLKSFVEKNFLPNFFIRERNQFIRSEFTHDIKNNILHYLERFLKDPTAELRWMLPSYRENTNTQICTLSIGCHRNFIIRWLQTQTSMAFSDPFSFRKYLLELYDGNTIECILERCDETLDKLKTVSYTQPLIKKLQNYMGVLKYILLMEEKKRGEDTRNSFTRDQYSEYMKLSDKGDLTHNTLRMATCYLHDDVKDECLKNIRRVTCIESVDHFYLNAFRDRLKQTLACDIEAFSQRTHTNYKMSLYKGIIYDIDFVHHDPYKTFEEFERLKIKGSELIGYKSLSLAWKQCYFDVTFMLAELPVLPEPAASELQVRVDNGQNHVDFHPFLYGLLLELCWHDKYGSGDKEKESVLVKMKYCVSKLPNEQKSIGLNFMTYGYLLQFDNCKASAYLIRSFKLNPVEQNVAYLYIKSIIQRFRLIGHDLQFCVRRICVFCADEGNNYFRNGTSYIPRNLLLPLQF